MKVRLTLQEKLKDLRTERKLSLDELAKETGLSRSALGSYEVNDFKDISHSSIVTLAKYYGVPAEYLLCLTENKEDNLPEGSELKLDDQTLEILKSGTINNRLLCEMIKHPEFWKFMSDLEIYVDNLAGMQIRNLNSTVAAMRSQIKCEHEHDVPDSELYLRTLKACEINEIDYFDRLLFEDLKTISKDIRETHCHDKESGEENNPLKEVTDMVKEYATTKDPTKTTLTILGKQLGMNFNKMEQSEVIFFSNIVQKYSTVYKSITSKKGRGRK
ncbi:MAG: helix-turn-helix domain-containing protein [Lachnospiraceae bacterium]|nr:helix-turn-helix domain-containing protein [Lachnospiraceae bacterium]